MSYLPMTGSEKHRRTVLCILYHISIDEKSRAIFVYTDCIQMVRNWGMLTDTTCCEHKKKKKKILPFGH